MRHNSHKNGVNIFHFCFKHQPLQGLMSQDGELKMKFWYKDVSNLTCNLNSQF